MRQRIQVVIILAMGGIALSLVILASRKAWEAEARLRCQNNIKQIILACHNWNDAYKEFPAATISNPDLPPEKRLSWLFALDPFLHARMDEHWKIQRDKAWDDPVHAHMIDDGLPCFLCPAGMAVKPPYQYTTYVGIAGLGKTAATYPRGDPGCGVFGYDRGAKLTDFPGGISNVIAVAETLGDVGRWAAGGPATCRGFDDAARPYLGDGGQFHAGHSLTNLGFGDGAVRPLSSKVDPKILEALVTLGGGDLKKLGE